VKKELSQNLYAAWHTPVFSSLLANQRELAIFAGIGVLHLGFSLVGVALWDCPIRAATGVPCPGCGLTRASLDFLRGDISNSLQTHAFAPLLVVGITLMLFMPFLPMSLRGMWIAKIRDVEERFGITAWLTTLLFLYWAIRLLGFPPFPDNF
jgi:hypothetical protein